MRRLFVGSLFIVSLCAILTAAGGCMTGAVSETHQLMLELDRSYTTGAISKQDYDRQRADLQEKRRREIVQSGSTVNESMRGILNEAGRAVIGNPR